MGLGSDGMGLEVRRDGMRGEVSERDVIEVIMNRMQLG